MTGCKGAIYSGSDKSEDVLRHGVAEFVNLFKEGGKVISS